MRWEPRGEHVEPALMESINNLGIIQRWELSYFTPFNEYDGTTRTIDFKLINLVGRDGTPITREIKDMDEPGDKQYSVQEEELVVEFEDPTGTSPKLTLVDERGRIVFLAKSRYHEVDSSGETIIIEDIIRGQDLNVLNSTDDSLLFSRNTDEISMSLDGDGWLPFKINKIKLEEVLNGREKSWVSVVNNSGKDILSYIDKARYRVEGNNQYGIELRNSEIADILANDLGDNPAIDYPTVEYLTLVVAGTEVNIAETVDVTADSLKSFQSLMGDRSDAWYELNNKSIDPNLFDGIVNDDFEKLDEARYRVKLRDPDLEELLGSTEGEDVELKISSTKFETLNGITGELNTFGSQGWYKFEVILTEDEMQILKDNNIELIDLEATAFTDLFIGTKILENVEVDVMPPKIVEVSVIDQTLRKFLKSMKVLEDTQLFTNTEAENYSGYTATNEGELEDLLSNAGSYVKTGDLLDITLIIEDKNLTEDDIYIGIDELGWKMPVITDESTTSINRFKLSWTGVEVGGASGTIGVGNTIEDSYGNTGDQNLGILNIDMTDIEPIPTLKYGTVVIPPYSDEKYYVNGVYNIDLRDVVDLYRAGIVVFNYNASLSDNKDGEPSYHQLMTGVYGGGTEAPSFKIGVDSNHKTDGEYIGQIFGMSKSGKLVKVTDYSDNNVAIDFDKILGTNYSSSQLTKTTTTIMVDTVTPQITDVAIAKSDENDENYYFDVSFKMNDFNASYKILVEGKKGGYSLGVEGNTSILGKSLEGETIVYKIEVKKGSSPITTITLKAEDKAGNETSREIEIEIPKDIEVSIYEDAFDDWYNITTQRTGDSDLSSGGYEFTKGGEK